MLIILFAFLLKAWAIPISTGSQTIPTLAHTIIWGIEPRSASDPDGSNIAQRTMYTIIRSCLLTIAACVYRAVHQNIPDPKASWAKKQRTRMQISFYAMIAPEAMIWWAMRQWIGAKEVANQVNQINSELNWTSTHGHFAQMGGFGRWDDERILHPPTLIELLKNGQIDIDELKRVTKQRINDQSKGDILSKAVVALQTTWFVFECLTRLQQKLPLIELEVVTLAFAILNTLTYMFWWNKPLNVFCPIYLRMLPPTDSKREDKAVGVTSTEPSDIELAMLGQEGALSEDEDMEPLLDHDTAGMEKRAKKRMSTRKTVAVPATGKHPIAQGLRKLFKKIGSALWGLVTATTDAIRAFVDAIKGDIEGNGWGTTAVQWFVMKPFLAIAEPLYELFNDDKVDQDANHVSTFYGMEISRAKYTSVLALSCSIGMVFGSIHFLSWHSSFPTHAQLLLWRISSVFLVAQPLGMLLEVYFLGFLFESTKRAVWHFFAFAPIALGLLGYILARFTVLVLAFFTLRDPPPGAFKTISWTTYIPHL